MIAREGASVGGGGRAPNCCSGSNKSDKSKSLRGGMLSLTISLGVSLSLVNKLSCGRKRRPISRNWNIVAIGNCQETWLQVGQRIELHTLPVSLFLICMRVWVWLRVAAMCACVCVWNKCEKQTTSSSADRRLCLLCVCALLESVGARASTPPRTVFVVVDTKTVNFFCFCCQALSKNGLNSNKKVGTNTAMPISDKI